MKKYIPKVNFNKGIVYLFGYSGSGLNHLRNLVLLSDSFDFLNIDNPQDRCDYITQKVYDRTFQTWYRAERSHRDSLHQNPVQADHNVWDIDDYKKVRPFKNIFLDASPLWCIRHFFKLNAHLEGVTSNHFLHSVVENSKIIKQELPEALILNHTFLCEKKLSLDFINSVEEFLNIKIPFSQASQVHESWYNMNMKAEKDFLQSVATIYGREKDYE